jgi:hypothetical protein
MNGFAKVRATLAVLVLASGILGAGVVPMETDRR